MFRAAVSAGIAPLTLACFDIDKPDLLHWAGKINLTAEEIRSSLPVFDGSKCNYCGACSASCKENAIQFNRFVPSVTHIVSRCSVCGNCLKACSRNGIQLRDKPAGRVYSGRLGANCFLAAEPDKNSRSGFQLVKALTERLDAESTCICDFGPGDDLQVSAGLAAMDLAVILIVPGNTWRKELETMQALAGKFALPLGIVVNKAIADADVLNEIKAYCAFESIPLHGIIPFRKEPEFAVDYDLADNQPIASSGFQEIWENILLLAEKNMVIQNENLT